MHIHWNMFGYANAGCGLPSTQTGGAVQLAGWGSADADADDSPGGANAASASGGVNPILQALAQALQSLGLSLESNAPVPSNAVPVSSSAAAASAPASPSDASSTPSAAAGPTASSSGQVDFREVHTIAHDIRHLMRALFMDVQAENMLAPASTGGSGSSFGSGLAALISQIQGGSVPANLQSAFDQLVSDLETIGGVSAASAAPVSSSTAPVASGTTSAAPPASAATVTTPAATASTASTASSTVAAGATATASAQSATTAVAGGVNYQGLLLQFLTNLQGDLGLGYGASSSAPAQGATSGLMVNTLA